MLLHGNQVNGRILSLIFYRADFIENGSVEFYSPELNEGNGQIPTLLPQPINLTSKQVRVGLGTTVADVYEIGNTFTQQGTNASGNLVGTATGSSQLLLMLVLDTLLLDGSFTFSWS